MCFAQVEFVRNKFANQELLMTKEKAHQPML